MTLMTPPGMQSGDYSVVAISDGYLSASLDLLSGITCQDAAALQQQAGISDPSAVHINCYLLRGRGRTVLIDAGAGGINQWGGNLQVNLARAGVQPAEIDTILLTHAHPDHIGGLLNASGEAAFPGAELVIQQREVTFWQDDANLSRASQRARGNFLFARKVFDRYRQRTRTFNANEVLPGISGIPLPGHTAGHSGYRIESGNESLLVWGDIVHFPSVQIAHTAVSIAFDLDPQLAAETRLKLLDQACSEQLLIAGMHLDERGFTRIERRGNRWRMSA